MPALCGRLRRRCGGHGPWSRVRLACCGPGWTRALCRRTGCVPTRGRCHRGATRGWGASSLPPVGVRAGGDLPEGLSRGGGVVLVGAVECRVVLGRTGRRGAVGALLGLGADALAHDCLRFRASRSTIASTLAPGRSTTP